MKNINSNFLKNQNEVNDVYCLETAYKLAQFHALCFTNYEKQYSEKSMLFFLENPLYHIFYTGIRLAILHIIGTEAELITLAIDPKHRKNGLGSNTLKIVVQYLKVSKISVLFLEVAASNHHAIRLYKKIGFKNVGIRKDYYLRRNQKPINAIKMSYLIDIKAQN